MTPFFAYLIKSSVSLAFLYCLFRITVRNSGSHALNRYILLGTLCISAVIPLLNIQLLYEEVQIAPVEFVREFISNPQQGKVILPENTTEAPEAIQVTSVDYSFILYLALSGIVFFRLLFGFLQVSKIIKRAKKQPYQKVILAVVKDFIQPFSFLNKIVLSEKDYNENKDIVVAHEYAHIKYLHAVDLMICELFTIVQFFNPFMWLLRRDLKLIHEYQADKAVLNKGIDAQKYQLLVLERAVGERRFAMANHFTQKPILKRLKMMQKSKTNSLNKLKVFLFVPVLILLITAFSDAKDKVLASNIIPEKIVMQPEPASSQIEYEGFFIELRKDGNYVDDNSCSIEQVVSKAKAFQKTGREDILLVLDKGLSLERIDEVRLALSKAGVYHVNQTTVGSDEIIYPHGDVTSLASYTQGNWREWMGTRLSAVMKDIPKDREFTVLYGFYIDKNGKVSKGHVLEGSDPEINKAYNKVLANIPDWKPAEKGKNNKVSVFYKCMDNRRIHKTVVKD